MEYRMPEVKAYYRNRVKRWTQIAERLHEVAENQGSVDDLIQEFGLQDVDPIDIDVISEYFRRFSVVEKGHVWKGSPANPLYYASVVAQAFLDVFNQAKEPESYVKRHYQGKEKAAKEIHETVVLAGDFCNALKGRLHPPSPRRQNEYANLIRGIYSNEIAPQTTSRKAFELGGEDSQFEKDLKSIWNTGYTIVATFFRSPRAAGERMSSLLTRINEDYIAKQYGDKPAQRAVMEKLLVELHMMKTAIAGYARQ